MWWSWDDLFCMMSRWKNWLADVLLPTAMGGLSWVKRVAGLASGCRTDARLGGVGLANTLVSLFCHSYTQGRKQAFTFGLVENPTMINDIANQ